MIAPYYQEDGITIYNARCEDILPELRGAFSCVLTDPPYGISHPTDYHDRGRDALAKCKNYAPVFGDDHPFDPLPWTEYPCVLFGANYYADKLPISSGWIVWDKERPEDLDQSTAELAWSNYVKGVRVFRYLWNGMLRDGDDVLVHPTQKPVALMEWIINLKWTPSGPILDP